MINSFGLKKMTQTLMVFRLGKQEIKRHRWAGFLICRRHARVHAIETKLTTETLYRLSIVRTVADTKTSFKQIIPPQK